MNYFIAVRDRIRQIIAAYEVIFLRIWNMVIGLVGVTCINHALGYQKTLTQWWAVLIVVVLCGFLPVKGVSLLIMLVALVHLLSLASDVAIVGGILIVVGYLLCAYFHSNDNYNMMSVPVCYAIRSPYSVAVAAGLMKSINEVTSVICGCFTAYYLHVVKLNASAILDETSDVSAISLLKDQMLRSKGFYFFLIAMVALFIVVYAVRQMEIHMSWLIAVLAGCAVEFFIMLAGCLMTGAKSEIPSLLLGNVIAIALGVLLNYLVLDLDYSRIEKVQFEDDDYYYYVTAVPKIRIAAEDKAFKKI